MKNKLFVFIILCFAVSIQAQDEDNRYTEDEIAVQDKFVEAKKYELIGRFEKAVDILKKLYEEDRNNPTISLELSKVYHLMEDPYNEYKYAEKALNTSNNNEYIMANYAMICIEQQKFEEAIGILFW